MRPFSVVCEGGAGPRVSVHAGRPLHTALLSDNDHLLLDALPQVLPEVRSRFDALLFSCRLGVAKPEPAVFIRALDLMNCAPGEAVFIDDKAANVAAAQDLGITAIQFSGATELSAALDWLLAPRARRASIRPRPSTSAPGANVASMIHYFPLKSWKLFCTPCALNVVN